MTNWYEEGERMLVPIEIEVPEGWDPSPPLPPDEEQRWHTIDEVVQRLDVIETEPPPLPPARDEDFPAAEAVPEVDIEEEQQ